MAEEEIDKLRDAELDSVDEPEHDFGFGSGETREEKGVDQKKSLYEKENEEDGEKSGSKGKLKTKKGPTAVIITLIASVSGLLYGSQALFPISFVNQVIGEFNSIGPSNSMRMDKILRKAMKNGVKDNKKTINNKKNKNLIGKTAFGKDKFKISRKQAKKLGKVGIEYDKKSKVLKYKGKNISAGELNDVLDADPDFRAKYLSGTQTWRGKIAGWFDKTMNKVIDRLGLGPLRNKFKNFLGSGETEADTEGYMAMGKSTNKGGASIDEVEEVDEPVLKEDGTPELDENGNEKTVKKNKVVGSETVDGDSLETDAGKQKLNTKVKDMLVSGANMTTNAVCGLLMGVNAIQLLIAANQSMEVINLVAGFLEAIHKTMAGDVDGSPLANYMSDLATPDKNGKTALEAYGLHSIFVGGGADFKAVKYKDQDNVGNDDPRADESFIKFNAEGIANAIPLVGATANAAQTLKNCATAKMVVNGVSVVIGIVADKLAPGGGKLIAKSIGGVIKWAKGQVFKFGATVLGSMAIKKIADFAVNAISKRFFSKVGSLGIDGGNALGAGANKYPGENAKNGGQSAADTETVLAYRREVLARYKEEERFHAIATRSPFDVTSQYTFLGSIMHSMAALYMNSPGITKSITSLGGITANSVIAMLPTADAIGDTKFLTTKGYCPMLDSIGVHADPFCNPYMVTDPSTMKTDPTDVYQKVYDLGLKGVDMFDNVEGGSGCSSIQKSVNFLYDNPAEVDPSSCKLIPKTTEDGNPVINPHSPLGVKIRFCDNRSSQLGMNDMNTVSWMKYTDLENGTLDDTGKKLAESTVASTIIDSIPLIGDIADVMDAYKDKKAADWGAGRQCVATGENEKWDSEIKYYQRYIEDQRAMENAGMIEQSAATKVIEEQLALEPLDNSREGLLARYSGMTKQQVIATLNFAEYLDRIAKYNPDGLAPLTWEMAPHEKIAKAMAENLNNEVFGIKLERNAGASGTGSFIEAAARATAETLAFLTNKIRYAIIEG